MSGGVRGPNSALTEFLRSKGIDATEIQSRHARRQREAEQAQAAATTTTVPSTEITEEIEETVTTTVTTRSGRRTTTAPSTALVTAQVTTAETSTSRASKTAMKKRKKPHGDDNSDAAFNPYYKAKPLPGQIAFCEICNCRFTVTPYSKSGPDGEGFICTACGKKTANQDKDATKKKFVAKKNKRKTVASLLDGEATGVKSLRDLAINVVAKHIDEVGQVMDCLQIGRRDVDKICQVISRNRALNDHTLKLFLDPGITRLNLYDCSKISTNELRKIGAILPTLRYLMLRFCGSMTDEVLSYYSTQLTELKGIELGGPFLVTKPCYMQFFEARGFQLEELTITDTFRVDADVISSLVDNCPNLKELRLRQIVKLDSQAVRLLTALANLKVLEISDPGEDLQDGAVIDVLNSIGSGLRELDLSGCMLLTDQTLFAVRQCCPRLNTFSLTEADDVTDEGVAQLFRNWDINPGLQYANLSRLRKLTYFGIEAILEHSGRTLEVLNLNSCPLQPDAWDFWWHGGTKLERLRSLDIGFVRSVNDAVVEKLCEVCPDLGELKVWGANHITEAVQVPGNIRIIGREADLHYMHS
ncbi:RNI-like protein [Terfezia boudieri ATCC MYA-4762]|uniref:RNI-like protein n=1 Tax=Terfezia boudieri ATCC MYA-4762 TaxID=1051890 RepID=A0A3N4M8F9_9PEZI|nr:RNI-like protein [Terfezia boudieri ATCC MYA-4762]